MYLSRLLKNALLLALPLALTACGAHRTAVKDVIADKEGYLHREYSPQNIRPEAISALAPGAAEPRFRQLRLRIAVTFAKETYAPVSYYFDSKIVHHGNGLLQEMREAFNNDVPSGIQYELNYAGLVRLKFEPVVYRMSHTLVPNQVHAVHEISPGLGRPAENSSFAFELSLGNPQQVMNFERRRTECRTGSYYPASQVNAALTGQALDVECFVKDKDHIVAKRKIIFVQDLGVYLNGGTNTSDASETYRYEAISVE